MMSSKGEPSSLMPTTTTESPLLLLLLLSSLPAVCYDSEWSISMGTTARAQELGTSR